MYYGKMWMVVKPSVGLPLFFAGVVGASLLIHAAVLTHTTWYPGFLQGGQHTAAAAASPVAVGAGAGGTPSIVINVAPK